MAYMEKGDSSEVVLVGYYNVLFYLIFKVGSEEYKKNILINRINSGEKMLIRCRGYLHRRPSDWGIREPQSGVCFRHSGSDRDNRRGR